MRKVLISLIGEQPIPNLLPLKYEVPDVSVLVHSEKTLEQARRIGELTRAGSAVEYISVGPYDIQVCRNRLRDLVQDRGWLGSRLLFNMTGGTKSMVLAAFEVAKEHRRDFLYLQSEGRKSRLYRYSFDAEGAVQLVESSLLPGLIDIDAYIRAHAGTYQVTGPARSGGGHFERAVSDALSGWVDEVLVGVRLGAGALRGALEVDLIVRCENQVGVIEVKTGRVDKAGIDQLNAAAGREFLGTYTRKFLVCDRPWDNTRSNLAALAAATNVVVIPVPSYRSSGTIAEDDAAMLGQTIRRELIGDAAVGHDRP